MKYFLLFCGTFIFLWVCISDSIADDLQSSREAVSQLLKKEGGGLVAQESKCPKKIVNLWEFVTDTQVVPINASSNAILINSEMCGGGNKNGQYLVVAQNGKSEVITNAEIGDMSFLGKITHVDGDIIYLSGMRWLENDPHCCPSKDAVLEYNVKTHKHGFKLTANRAN
jgi:hypothetical protein